MRKLQKKVNLGLGFLGLFGVLLSVNLPTKVTANAISNAAVIEVPGGNCTGPKNGECKSMNTNACSDMYGCESKNNEIDE